jgi:hypothetical protein
MVTRKEGRVNTMVYWVFVGLMGMKAGVEPESISVLEEIPFPIPANYSHPCIAAYNGRS